MKQPHRLPVRVPLLSPSVQVARPPLSLQCRPFAVKRGSPDNTDEELAAARKWLSNLNAATIPRSICDVSFSRSSGAGGQNVNKVSSKATLRLSLNQLLPLLPAPLHPAIQQSRYHASKTSDLVIQCDDSRKQADNINGCFKRLHELLVLAGHDSVPGETAAGQKERVAKLQKAEAAGRRRLKESISNKKSARRGGGRSDD